MSDVMCIMTRLWYIHRVWYTAERYRPSGTGRVVGPFVLTLQLYAVLTFSQVSRGCARDGKRRERAAAASDGWAHSINARGGQCTAAERAL